MANYQITTAYDAEGLANQLEEWFGELVPGITVSKTIWEQMAPNIIESLNKDLIEIRVTRDDYRNTVQAPVTVLPGSNPPDSPADTPKEKPEGLEMPVEAKFGYKQVDAETIIPMCTTYPENTEALLVSGNKVYPRETLRGAINLAESEDDKVVLLKDVSLHGMLRIDRKIRLDLNNRTITSNASDYAIWVKEDAIITNGYIHCLKPCKAAIYVSSTLVVGRLAINATKGIQLTSGKHGPAMLETHGMEVLGAYAAILMSNDGNLVNIHDDGITCSGLIAESSSSEILTHKVMIHTSEGKTNIGDYPSEKFSEGIRVTFL